MNGVVSKFKVTGSDIDTVLVTSVDSIVPEQKDLIQTVYASGRVYPIDYVKIASKTNGYINEVFVKPGDSVFKGQPLLTIESANSDVSVEIANQQLQYNEAVNRTRTMQLESAWQDVLAAASKYSLDSTNMQRYKNLLREDITTRANFDQAQTLSKGKRSNLYVRAVRKVA